MINGDVIRGVLLMRDYNVVVMGLLSCGVVIVFFFFNDTATTEIYTE